MPKAPALTRREELLKIAAKLFAERGFGNTTVRDIADAAGILSGSLYHHFDSKESMVDEILAGFQAELFATYDEIIASNGSAREKIEALVKASFAAIENHHAEVAIFQNDANYLASFPRFHYLNERNNQFRELWHQVLAAGVTEGNMRADLDISLAYRFIRDTVWVAVRWYQPDGTISASQVAEEYLKILLDGIVNKGDRNG